jgi:molecular chaperone DnaK (HSP70)
MDRRKKRTTADLERRDSLITEPERQLGGPESGLPPPFIIGSDVVPHFIVGLDFGRQSLRASTFSHSEGKPVTLTPKNLEGVIGVTRDGLPYATLPSENARFWNPRELIGTEELLELDSGKYTGTYLTAVLLQNAKRALEEQKQRLLAKAVISVPASFNHLQRRELIKAGEMAGIRVLALINQSTAAALAFLFESQNPANGPYLVVSIGASECELAVIHVHEKLLEVRSIRSSDEVSGDRIYDLMRDELLRASQSKEPATIAEESSLWETMRYLRSQMKKASSEPDEIVTPFRGVKITVGMVTEAMAPITVKLNKLIAQGMSDSGFREDQFVGLIVSGAAARSWPVLPWLQRRFKSWPISLNNLHDVSDGAAIHAALIARQNRDWVVWEAMGSSLFMKFNGKAKRVFPANSPLPLTAHVQLLAKEMRVEHIEFSQQPNGMEKKVIVVAAKASDVPKYRDKKKKVELTIHMDSDGLMSYACRDAQLDLALPLRSLLIERDNGILPSEPIKPPPVARENLVRVNTPNPIKYVETDEPTQPNANSVYVRRMVDEIPVETPYGKFRPGVSLEGGSTKGSVVRQIEPIVIASTNDLQLYDVISCIRHKEVGPPEGDPLHGSFGEEIVFTVVRGEHTTNVALPCVIPALSWRQLDLEARLAEVREEGSQRKIIAQLIQNGSFYAYYADVPDPQRARELLEDAVLMAYAPRLQGGLFGVIALAEMCGCLMAQLDLDPKFAKQQIRWCVAEMRDIVLKKPLTRPEVPYYLFRAAKILGQSKIRDYFRFDTVMLLELLVTISRDMSIPDDVKDGYARALESFSREV